MIIIIIIIKSYPPPSRKEKERISFDKLLPKNYFAVNLK